MEPKKLFGSIGVILTTIASVVLFIVEYDKIKKFFFPESLKLGISLQFYVFSLIAFNAIVFYILYIYYYAEKEKHRKTKIELENAKQQLLDSEKLRQRRN